MLVLPASNHHSSTRAGISGERSNNHLFLLVALLPSKLFGGEASNKQRSPIVGPYGRRRHRAHIENNYQSLNRENHREPGIISAHREMKYLLLWARAYLSASNKTYKRMRMPRVCHCLRAENGSPAVIMLYAMLMSLPLIGGTLFNRNSRADRAVDCCV